MNHALTFHNVQKKLCQHLHPDCSRKIIFSDRDFSVWTKLKQEFRQLIQSLGYPVDEDQIFLKFSDVNGCTLIFPEQLPDLDIQFQSEDPDFLMLFYDLTKILCLAYPQKLCARFESSADFHFNNECQGDYLSHLDFGERFPELNFYTVPDCSWNWKEGWGPSLSKSKYFLRLTSQELDWTDIDQVWIRSPWKVQFLLKYFPRSVVNHICTYLYRWFRK